MISDFQPDGGAQGYFGLYPAIVTDLVDPERLGRIQVKLPWLGEDGDRDVRVPIEEGRGFYNAVKGRVNAKFVEIKDMPHSLPWWPDHYRQSLNAIDEWLKSDNCFGS